MDPVVDARPGEDWRDKLKRELARGEDAAFETLWEMRKFKPAKYSSFLDFVKGRARAAAGGDIDPTKPF